MSDGVKRSSPLGEFPAAGAMPETDGVPGVRLSERAFLGHINLRGDPSTAAFQGGVEVALNVTLPLVPNTVVEGPELTALWLGPDEWLLLTDPGQQYRILEALRTSLSDVFAAVTDVSAGQTVINLQGPHGREVLSKGCTLDLHPRVFGTGQCAQTNVAKTSAIIRQLDDTPSYDLIVRRSFALYLAQWLTDAAGEYGIVVGSSPIG